MNTRTVRVDQLLPGDLVWTAAHRWETVRLITAGTLQARVWTDRTAESYSWMLNCGDQVEIDPVRSPEQANRPGPAKVMITANSAAIMASIALDAQHVWEVDAHRLVWATPAGRGKGWVVRHCPTGDPSTQQTTPVASKAQARSLVARYARNHARSLGLALVPGITK